MPNMSNANDNAHYHNIASWTEYKSTNTNKIGCDVKITSIGERTKDEWRDLLNKLQLTTKRDDQIFYMTNNDFTSLSDNWSRMIFNEDSSSITQTYSWIQENNPSSLNRRAQDNIPAAAGGFVPPHPLMDRNPAAAGGFVPPHPLMGWNGAALRLSNPGIRMGYTTDNGAAGGIIQIPSDAAEQTRKRTRDTSDEMEQLRTENKRLRTENDSMRNRIAVLEQQLAASRSASQGSLDVEFTGVTRTDAPVASFTID
jgi:hypothetical protein